MSASCRQGRVSKGRSIGIEVGCSVDTSEVRFEVGSGDGDVLSGA